MTYTLAITSCNRHDLLRKTLSSFVECVSQNPVETIILEDGPAPRPAWLADFFPKLGGVKWINNDFRMGQSYSIDRLYREIKTEFIFWCEDDWLFHEGNFLQRSHQILTQHPNISMVALRSDWNHPVIDDPRGFQIAEPYWGGVWGGTCWNPGLRRRSDFLRYGSYGRHVGYGTNGLGHEKTWSQKHLDDGFRIAVLPKHCFHIGGECSRAIEPLEKRIPKVLIAIPACDTFDYGRWESGESPKYDPKHEAYGTDIHISGPNPRVQAVRETWFKDVKNFEGFDAKFFYGTPHPDRRPEVDEVFLDTPGDYGNLPLRSQAIAKYALENGFDFVLKCDDDTAVYVDRIAQELIGARFDYAGYTHCNVCSGGPGYFLSKLAMRIVVEAGTPDFWAEDVWVSKVLGLKNINPVQLSGHTPGFAAHWFWPNGYDKSKLNQEISTIHAVQPEMMRTWYRERDNG